MQNVHLVPTDSPSRLGYLSKKGKDVFKDLRLFDTLMPIIFDSENQHLYITSNEVIQDGDYVLQTNFEKTNCYAIKCINSFQTELANATDGSFTKSKIILTTDQSLISDGVQSIDDEFLEWFVRNSSCEEVEVTYGVLKPFESENKGYLIHCPDNEPLEEPKQSVQEYEQQGLEKHFYQFQQESLEEAAKKYSGIAYNREDYEEKYYNQQGCDRYDAFIEGSKWQQEQILGFLYDEITERRDYSASKMCEEVVKFIESLNKNDNK